MEREPKVCQICKLRPASRRCCAVARRPVCNQVLNGGVHFVTARSTSTPGHGLGKPMQAVECVEYHGIALFELAALRPPRYAFVIEGFVWLSTLHARQIVSRSRPVFRRSSKWRSTGEPSHPPFFLFRPAVAMTALRSWPPLHGMKRAASPRFNDGQQTVATAAAIIGRQAACGA